MQAKTSTRRKPKRLSQRNRRDANENKVLFGFRYFGESRKGRNTKGINHPNFVKPLNQIQVDINQSNINIVQDSYRNTTLKIDYVKFVRDIYPQVADLLYIFEHELSSKHKDPKIFTEWMLTGLYDLNQTDLLLDFNLNTNTNRYEARVLEDSIHSQQGACAEVCWITQLEESDDARMLKTCIKMLSEDCHVPTYWNRVGEISLDEELESALECITSEIEEGCLDDEELKVYQEYRRLYNVDAIDLAEDIMSQKIDYYEVLEYSESDSKYSELAKHVWKLVANDFRLYYYSNETANINYGVEVEQHYAGIDKYNAICFNIDESDPVWWHFDQSFQSYANEAGVEPLTIVYPIEQPEKKELKVEILDSYRRSLELIDIYSEGYARQL